MRATPSSSPSSPPPPWIFVVIVVIVVLGGGVAWLLSQALNNRVVVTDPTATPVTSPQATATEVAPIDVGSTVTPLPVDPTVTVAPAARFLTLDEIVYAAEFDADTITSFLQQAGGELADVKVTVGGRRYPFPVALLGQTLYYSASPKTILALLEYQAGLVTQSGLPDERYRWAVGYRGDPNRFAGMSGQIRWAVRELFYARRDLPLRPPLTYADGVTLEAPADLNDAQYVMARVLAPTIASGQIMQALTQYADVYVRLFGALSSDEVAVAVPPAILHRPLQTIKPVTSFFDHSGPFLTRNMSDGVTTYWGFVETNTAAFAYDGHDGWDYAAAPPDLVLASADGKVIFAGTADDGCNTGAVIIDHGDDLRTLYWHLSQVTVEVGQRVSTGEEIGVVGNTGCSKGPHLHFGVHHRGVSIDPYGWCGREADPWQTHPAGAPSYWLWADYPSPCGPVPATDVLVDSNDPVRFTIVQATPQTVLSGVQNDAFYVVGQRGVDALRPWRARPFVPLAVARWQAELPVPGRYRVSVYIPYALSGLIDSDVVYYQVQHRDGVSEVPVRMQIGANEWIDLGTYAFDGPASVVLPLRDSVGGRGVWIDAILWQSVEGGQP
ncbi:MAG: peptidoglycan DD-metalloendopeptidase family protein [Chloroflexota bacterium]|jgi:murein DD-endopeptidase MepM/ murein hydrolase activator NlpD